MSKSDTTTLESTDGDGDAESDGEAPADRYPALAEAEIREDSDLAPSEKEWQFRGSKADRTGRIYSEVRGHVRRVLYHSAARVTKLRVRRADEIQYCGPSAVRPDDAIHAVWAEVPDGFVTLTTTERTTGSRAGIISEAVYDGRDGDAGRDHS